MLTENQIKNLKHRLNENLTTIETIRAQTGLPQTLEDNHTFKGLAWIIKVSAKRNSAFGERERAIIENFARFELINFIDTKPYSPNSMFDNHHWFQPVYRVYSNTNSHFDYYYDFQKVNILV